MGEHPERHLAGYTGILQADAYAGFNQLYAGERRPGPLVEAACWAHARRRFFVLADAAANARGKLPVVAPLALEAVSRIDALFAIEREITGLPAATRLAVRRERSAPLLHDLEAWMRTERSRLSRHAEVAKAMDYMLKRWGAFARFLDDGRICLTNNAAERALRGIALGRKAWAVCRFRSRRRARGADVHAAPDGPPQRRRSAGLAFRRLGPQCRPPIASSERAPALELETGSSTTNGRLSRQSGRVNRARKEVSDW
jgi:hypothetical protein